MSTMYECGECHNNTLVIRATPDPIIAGRWGWDVMCGRGHPVVPIPGSEFVITEGPPSG